jgi:hypothetical protein
MDGICGRATFIDLHDRPCGVRGQGRECGPLIMGCLAAFRENGPHFKS